MALMLQTLPDTVEAGLYTPNAISSFRNELTKFEGQNRLRRFAGGTTAEAVAFEAFQAYVRFIEASSFVYSFSQVGVPWDRDSAWETGVLRGNCMNLALGFNYLLQHLGFPIPLLGLQQSFPSVPNLGKISQRANPAISPQNVRGVTSFTGAWEYLTMPYPQARIPATNALHVRRGSWFPGRHYESQEVTKSHRDVFENHWCSHLKLSGVQFPFFDPLVGARYRNGQDDMFETLLNIGSFTYKEFANNPVYRSVDNSQTLIYAIPPFRHASTTSRPAPSIGPCRGRRGRRRMTIRMCACIGESTLATTGWIATPGQAPCRRMRDSIRCSSSSCSISARSVAGTVRPATRMTATG